MHWGNNLKRLQVDMTSYCNAKCGACARNLQGGQTLPGLKLQHFSLDVWEKLAQDTAGKINQLYLNGNWGDPGMHPHLIPMMETWIKYHRKSDIVICTNGSMHKPDWWGELATVLKDHKHRIQVSIDGIGNDHALYRRNTDYNCIIENFKKFNANGGNSEWRMTLWDYNLNYIDKAKALATMLGFCWFSTRRNHSPNGTCMMNDDEGNYEYTITSNEAKNISLITENLPTLEYRQNARTHQDSHNESRCPWYNMSEVQIDPFHKVWPCCNISIYGIPEYQETEFDRNELPSNDWNSLEKHSIYDILEHHWYNNTLSNAIDNASYEVCRNNCSLR